MVNAIFCKEIIAKNMIMPQQIVLKVVHGGKENYYDIQDFYEYIREHNEL